MKNTEKSTKMSKNVEKTDKNVKKTGKKLKIKLITAKNHHKYRKTVKNAEKSKNCQKCRKTLSNPSKISKNRQKHRKI